MLTVNDLTLIYKGESHPAVKELSCSWETTGIVAVVGSSGIGKSTLLQCVAGIQTRAMPTVSSLVGSISVDGFDPDKIRGPRSISWVPQAPTLLAHLTVLRNVLLPIASTEPGNLGACTEDAEELLRELSLDRFRNAKPCQLSGGMKSRVSMARALVTTPRYLYLDEPFNGLDLGHRWDLYKLVLSRRSEGELSTLFTSHNLPESVLISSKIVVIHDVGGQTRARVIANDPALVAGEDPGACLDKARRKAAIIEAEAFF